jgi:ferrous iron transport protein A
MAIISLDKLVSGQSATITALNHDESVLVRLMEMGLLQGQPVVMVRRAPLGDPIEFRVGETHLSLRVAEAALVDVEVEAAL